MNIWEYIFIGAGTANLAAARRLIEAGVSDILILERGSLLGYRTCPGVKPQTCFFCERGCSILSGLGGTNALFGNKLCYFPASSSILANFSSIALVDAWRWLDNVLAGYFDSSQNKLELETDDLGRKHYRSVVLSRSEFRNMINTLVAPLVERNAIMENCCVDSVIRDGSTFLLETNVGKFRTKHVVVGTGRAGGQFLRGLCASFGIPISENQPDVGIRIEAPKTFFSRVFSYQEDPKFKFQSKLGVMRTFCAENRGMIVPVMLDDAFFAEGAYPEPFSGNSNIALMVRSKTHLPFEKLSDWCKTVNANQHENLLTAELNADGITAIKLMAEINKHLPAMPTPVHRRLLLQIVEHLSRTHTSLFRHDGRLTGKVRLFAPAIDNYWPRPEVVNNLETRIQNLFILGDAVGISRGYVQALTTGAAWAYQHLGIATRYRSTQRVLCHSSV